MHFVHLPFRKVILQTAQVYEYVYIEERGFFSLPLPLPFSCVFSVLCLTPRGSDDPLMRNLFIEKRFLLFYGDIFFLAVSSLIT